MQRLLTIIFGQRICLHVFGIIPKTPEGKQKLLSKKAHDKSLLHFMLKTINKN